MTTPRSSWSAWLTSRTMIHKANPRNASKMRLRYFAFVVLFVLFGLSQAFNLARFQLQSGRRLRGKISDVLPPFDEDQPMMPQNFVQKLDHFNHQEERTWNQRYYYNATVWAPGRPIFFQFGGENPVWPRWQLHSQIAEYANKFGALHVMLEHRYYGFSWPLGDTSLKNLTYLSSEQALADAAYFLQSFKKMIDAPEHTPVITFGGSYSGALAAWFRFKYPHVTMASVASSAPVHAVVDFYDYLGVVDKSLKFFFGASCTSAIRNATEQIQMMLKTPAGQIQLQKLFNWCGPIADPSKDIPSFMATLMGIWESTVQYNQIAINADDIPTMCKKITAPGATPLDNYAKLVNLYFDALECLDISYKSIRDRFAHTEYDMYAYNNGRAWLYQSCTEFGFFQTTDSAEDQQPFGNLVPIEHWLGLCKDVFGRSFDTYQLAEDTNTYYGGNLIDAGDGTSILYVLFTNGNIDPWSALSITSDLDPNLRAIFINGTSHCADMLQPNPLSSPSLAVAQAKIAEHISVWLSKHYSKSSRSGSQSGL